MGVRPLAATLVALEATVDSGGFEHPIVLTLADVSAWEVVDDSSLVQVDDSAVVALEREYWAQLQSHAKSGPAPPPLSLREPGVAIGLIRAADWPVLSPDPRPDLMTDAGLFGHRGWRIPRSVSLDAFGELLTLRITNGTSASSEAVVSDFVCIVHESVREVDGWFGQGAIESDPSRCRSLVIWPPEIDWIKLALWVALLVPLVIGGIISIVLDLGLRVKEFKSDLGNLEAIVNVGSRLRLLWWCLRALWSLWLAGFRWILGLGRKRKSPDRDDNKDDEETGGSERR